MTYTPHLIAKYVSGLDQSVQPWLLPDEAQEELLDGYVYRGVWQKREGYNYFADGGRGGTPYTESRMVHAVSAEAFGTGDGTAGPYTHTLAELQVQRGSVTITAALQVVTDVGDGTLTGDGTGTINYLTGDVSVTFSGAVAGAVPITVDYNSMPGYPVMMVANFYTATNTRQLIVADTHYVNRYNSTTNRLEDISPASAYTGDNHRFFTWVNYNPAAGTPRLLFANYKDPIQSYDGTTVTDYVFTLAGITTLTTLLMFEFKDRLILLRTIEDGTTYGKRIRVSGTGANSDVFDTTATGAGVIDIPSASFITGAAFNRDDLIIFTETESWILKYTGNDIVPFVLDKLDPSRGCQAPFSGITYLNRTTAVSPTGFIVTDGYRVERMDDKIPTYSYDQIDQDNFDLCFAGTVDEDRDHYLIHPSPNASASDRILVTNYEEDNFSIYRIPLSCMGNYIDSFDVTWNDLNWDATTRTGYEDWDSLATTFGSWNDFSYMKGTPIAIGGGHNGEIWRLNLTEQEDNPVPVRDIVVVDSTTITVTTDFQNYVPGDYIYFEGVEGISGINDKQYAIESVDGTYDHNIFTIVDGNGPFSGAYTEGGIAARVIPFSSKTKKFNPFVQQAAKVRCGWMYFYLTTSGTFLTDDNDDPVPAELSIDVICNDNEQATQVYTLYFTNDPYQADATNLTYSTGGTEVGIKRWAKLWINQTARLIQFRVRNTQAGAKIKIQAMMPGFAGVGRLV